MGKSFTSKGKKQRRSDDPDLEPVEFELDGETYLFTPPSSDALTLRLLKVRRGQAGDAQREVLIWFGKGLNGEHEQSAESPGHDAEVNPIEGCQACVLEARLADPDDDLDIDTIGDVIDYLVEVAYGRPPTSRTGSSASRRRAGPSSTAGAPPAG